MTLIFLEFTEKSDFQRGDHQKLIYREGLPRPWTVCRFKGGLVRKRGDVFRGG